MDTERIKSGRTLRIVNYSIALLFALLGISVLAGYPIELQGGVRWLLGAVLLLWAIYRGIATRTKFPVQ
jgi:hypothetical protein